MKPLVRPVTPLAADASGAPVRPTLVADVSQKDASVTVGTLSRQFRFTAIGLTSLVAFRLLLAAGDGVKHPTTREIKDGYVGTVFSRLPDRSYTTWMVHFADVAESYGVSHVEDRGVEMLWLESTPLTNPDNPRAEFKVVDVVVLPATYRADGLAVIPCRGGAPGNAIVVLTEEETRKLIRAWAIDFKTATFVDVDPATAKWAPLFIREDD